MRSRHHFPVSLAVGVACVLAVETGYPAVLVVWYAGLLGTFVDLDHFLIAWLNTGSWEPLVRCLRDPRLAFLDQSAIFAADDVSRWERLASHAVITAVVVGCLAPLAPPLAVVSAAVLLVHVVTDLAWDQWRLRRGV